MKNTILVSILLFSLVFNACAQKGNDSVVGNIKMSSRDSLRYDVFMDSVDIMPLFSLKRQYFLDSVLLITPKDPQLWQQKAMPLFKQQKYELGMPYLDMAVKYDNEFHHFLEYRAFIKCIFQKSYRAAIIDFDAAIQKKGNSYVMDHTYEFYKGLCYLQLNEIDSAQYFVTKCINERRLAKGDEWVHYLHLFYQGVIFKEQYNFPLAIQSFDACLKIYPQLPDAMYHKAMCLYEQKHPKEALALLLQAQIFKNKGYGINEDNTLYETYPYQINTFFLEGYIDILKKEIGDK